MGAEQSIKRNRISSGAPIGSRQGSLDEAPYGTASHVSGDSPRRLLKTQSLSTGGVSGGSALLRSSPKSASLKYGPATASGRSVIVVNQGGAEIVDSANDPALLMLQKLPVFFPIVRETVRNPLLKEITGPACRLDVPSTVCLLSRYQSLEKENAELVAREQMRLSQRSQDMDYAIGTLHQVLQDRSRKLSKQSDQLATINQIRALLNSTRMCLQKTFDSLERINACLPPEHRLLKPDLALDLSEPNAVMEC